MRIHFAIAVISAVPELFVTTPFNSEVVSSLGSLINPSVVRHSVVKLATIGEALVATVWIRM